jgi:hypothetical protein
MGLNSPLIEAGMMPDSFLRGEGICDRPPILNCSDRFSYIYTTEGILKKMSSTLFSGLSFHRRRKRLIPDLYFGSNT